MRTVLTLTAVLLIVLTGCGGAEKETSSSSSAAASPAPVSPASPATAPASSSAEGQTDPVLAALTDGRHTVIDVRTPEEFGTGHLKGAKNMDVQAPDFATQISALPKDGEYVVYCRSGSRSATAKTQMEATGFTDVLNAGGFEALRAAGAPTE